MGSFPPAPAQWPLCSSPRPAWPPRPASPVTCTLPAAPAQPPSLPPSSDTHGSEDTEPERGRRPEAPGRLGRGALEPAAGWVWAPALPLPSPAWPAGLPLVLGVSRLEGSTGHPLHFVKASLPLLVSKWGPAGGLGFCQQEPTDPGGRRVSPTGSASPPPLPPLLSAPYLEKGDGSGQVGGDTPPHANLPSDRSCPPQAPAASTFPELPFPQPQDTSCLMPSGWGFRASPPGPAPKFLDVH